MGGGEVPVLSSLISPEEGKVRPLKAGERSTGLRGEETVQRGRLQVGGQGAESVRQDAPPHVVDHVRVWETKVYQHCCRVGTTAGKLSDGLVEGALQGLDLTVREQRDRSIDVREDQGGPELEGCSDW